MRKCFLHIFFLFITLGLSLSSFGQFFVKNTVLAIDSTEFSVSGMRFQLGDGAQDSYMVTQGGAKALVEVDSLINNDSIYSDGKIVINDFYQSISGAGYFQSGDSVLVKGDWENTTGTYAGDGIISFQAISDTQLVQNPVNSNIENGFLNAVIDGGSRKLIRGNFFAKNLYLNNGIMEPENSTDTIALGYGPEIVVNDTTSFVEGKIYVQDTGTVILPIGENGLYRPVLLTGVKPPVGWVAPTTSDSDSLQEARWAELPLIVAETETHSVTGANSDSSYLTFANRSWFVDAVIGDIDSAQINLYYNSSIDMPSGATFNQSELMVMDGDSTLLTSNYDTLGLFDTGTVAAFNLNFVTSNLLQSGTYNRYFFIGTEGVTCPPIFASVGYQNPLLARCLGTTTTLLIDTSGTNNPSVSVNEALWQDSTIHGGLTYDVTGAGLYRAVLTYNNLCTDTTDYFAVSYNPSPKISFIENTYVTNGRIVDNLHTMTSSRQLFDIAETNLGDLYVTDSLNNEVVKLDASLNETPLTPTIPFDDPMGVAVYNNLAFIADRGNKVVRVVSPLSTSTASVYAGASLGSATTDRQGDEKRSPIFESPVDIAVDSARNLYVADDNLNVIRVVSRNGGFNTIGRLPSEPTVAGAANLDDHDFTEIRSVGITNENKLIVVDGSDIKIVDITNDTVLIADIGSSSVDSRIGSLDLSEIQGVNVLDNGNFIVSVPNGHYGMIYDPDSNSFALVAGDPGVAGFQNGVYDSAQFNMPLGSVLSYFRGGEFLAIDQGNNSIRSIKDSTYASFCPGLSATAEVEVSPLGGTFAWEFEGATIPSETSNQISISNQGKYTASYTSPAGCTASHDINLDLLDDILTQVNIYNLGLGLDTTFCEGTSVDIQTNAISLGIDSLDWLTQDKISLGTYKDSSDIIVSAQGDSTIYLAMQENICQDTIQVDLTEVLPPQLNIATTSSNSCSTSDIPLSASALGTSHPIPSNNVFSWSLAGFGGGSFSPSNDTTSLYTVVPTDTADKLVFVLTFTNGCGMISDSTDSISVISSPIASISKDPPELLATTIDGFSLIDSSSIFTTDQNSYRYEWLIGGDLSEGSDLTFTYDSIRHNRFDNLRYLTSTPTEKGIRLTITDTISGCSDTDSITLNIVSYKVLYVPNAFSPNSAKLDENKVFKCYGVNISDQNFDLRVYNRWGEVVYGTSDYYEASQVGWNGLANNTGIELESGVYTYTLKGQFADVSGGKVFSKTGSVTLIR